jgi:hypothetical protein
LPELPGVLVARKHHLLVRWSHWLNMPILLGLIWIYNHDPRHRPISGAKIVNYKHRTIRKKD